MEYTINIKGRLMDLNTPQVMGILNVTPDSFYSGSRKQTEEEIANRANQIIAEGGSIIDIGLSLPVRVLMKFRKRRREDD